MKGGSPSTASAGTSSTRVAARIATHRGHRVIGVNPVPERRARQAHRGVEVIDPAAVSGELGDAIREMTGSRGPDSVIDAVGMEAHGSPAAGTAHAVVGMLPKLLGTKMMENAGVDKLAAFYSAIDIVSRGGTISLPGIYGGGADPLPMLTMFDKQLTLRMGQANVKHWVPEIMPLLTDDDPLGLDDFATHRVPLFDAPRAYEQFQKILDGAVTLILTP